MALPPDITDDPTDAIAVVGHRRALPVASGAHAICLVATGEVDAAVIDREPTEAARTIAAAAGVILVTVGPLTVAGRVDADPSLAHRVLEVRRARAYRADPVATDAEPLTLVRLRAGSRIADAGRLSRAQGTLFGQVAGDDLGQLVEFAGPDAIARRYPNGGPRLLEDGGVWQTMAGQPTDDSEMALCLARAIIGADQFDREAVAQAYARWASGNLPTHQHVTMGGLTSARSVGEVAEWGVNGSAPRDLPFDIGTTVGRAARTPTRADFAAGRVAEAMTQVASKAIPSNGALMRVAPIGVWGAGRDVDTVAVAARADAALTHGHPYAMAASAAFAVAVAHAIWSGATPYETWRVALDLARGPHGNDAVAQTLEAARESPPSDYMTYMGAAHVALQNAFFRLLHADSIEAALEATIRAGGDTDTTAAITGALMGAVHGRDTIPWAWRRLVTTCRPLRTDTTRGDAASRSTHHIAHPRPPCLWPTDLTELAERLLLVTR